MFLNNRSNTNNLKKQLSKICYTVALERFPIENIGAEKAEISNSIHIFHNYK